MREKLAERGDIDIALKVKTEGLGSFIDIPLDDKKTKVKKAKSAVNGIDTDIADSKGRKCRRQDLSWIHEHNQSCALSGQKCRQHGFCNCRGYLKRKVGFWRFLEQTEHKLDAETENIVKSTSQKSKKDNSEAGDELRNSLTELFVPIILKKKKKVHRF